MHWVKNVLLPRKAAWKEAAIREEVTIMDQIECKARLTDPM